MIGTRLAHYEITAHLGSGGMGDVYQATDTKLGRRVAIKLLPAAFAADAERLSRFRREAQALAALNHFNIAQIYGIEDAGGTSCIVMELVEGETLQARIQHGPIAIAEALAIAKQIAEALEAAHEKGVIHRDLKPGNIMLADGKVKVLDFGLAKAYDTPSANTDLAHSPTLTGMAATSAGVILGTAAYMSPEQAKGRAVDRRTDIFAFGCVLYEMLTAKRAFDGEDVTDILGAVLRVEPDWSQLPDGLPSGVRRLLRLCLEKNPKNRRSDATDIRLDLEHFLNEPATAAPAPIEIAKRPSWARAVPVVSALVLGAILSGAAVWNLRPATAPGAAVRFAVTLPQDQSFSNTGRKFVAVSPDGSAVAYAANQRLYIRQLSEPEARPVPGTDTLQAVLNPVFSPDSRSIAFWAGSDRTLKKIAVSGGAAVTLSPAATPVFGLSWSDGVLVFGQDAGGIYRVSENGGKPERIVSVKDNEGAHGPQILPGGKAILYTVRGAAGNDWDKAQIFVQSLEPGSSPQLLIDGGREARFVSTGHIVYAYQGTLFAIPFDVNELKTSGGPTPVVEGVRNSGATTGASQFSIADNGTLIYVPGPLSGGSVGAPRTLAYRDRSVNGVERLKVPPRAYSHPRVSPDGMRVAVSTDDDKPDVWIIDLAGTSAPRQLTLGGNSRIPVWSADGLRVAFRSNREGDDSIFWQKADGTGAAERLTKAETGTFHVPSSWSPDGKYLAYTAVKGSDYTWRILSLADKKDVVVAERAGLPEFSPDGRWVAYQSDEIGQRQIFVQPFPVTGARYPVVPGGHPFWSSDGSELFYNPRAQQIGVVRINTRPTFSFGEPVVFSTAGLQSKNPATNPRVWDIAPDRKRLIGVTEATESTTTSEAPTLQIDVVLNWFTDLKARVPN
ncbi:MAG TPA: protein kinase [Vicinamibacterales bacterium]|nr:protein kinase [Vicinamibacterales bacterium]